MSKVIVSVQDSLNLTAQTPKYMEAVDRKLVGMTSANFNLSAILALGDPSIVCLIHMYLSFATTPIIDTIKELNKRGYIIMFSLTANTPSTTNSFMYQLGITNTVENWSSSYPLSFYTKDNTFFNISGYLVGGSTINYKTTVSGRNFGSSLAVSTLKVPITTIATVSSTNTDVYFGIVEGGTQLNGFVSVAPLIFAGFLYTAENHTDNIYNILADIYTYCDINSKAPYFVEGYVSTNNKVPLERLISVHKQINGALINTSTSNSMGYYKVGLPTNDPVFIVCHPEDSSKRGLIHTYVIPVESERDESGTST